jgi:hypothetical protein
MMLIFLNMIDCDHPDTTPTWKKHEKIGRKIPMHPASPPDPEITLTRPPFAILLPASAISLRQEPSPQ